MNKNNLLPPDHDLHPDLQQAVKKALTATDDLCPPPHYDATYWREEREAIARLAVCHAAQTYQERDGVSREAFGVICAKRAIYEEWRRGRERERGVVSIPVDEETGEEVEFVDVQAQEEIEMNALCTQVREVLERLRPEDKQLVEWYYGEELSLREVAAYLGKGKSVVQDRIQRIVAWLRGEL